MSETRKRSRAGRAAALGFFRQGEPTASEAAWIETGELTPDLPERMARVAVGVTRVQEETKREVLETARRLAEKPIKDALVSGFVLALRTLPPPIDRRALAHALCAARITVEQMRSAGCLPTDIEALAPYAFDPSKDG